MILNKDYFYIKKESIKDYMSCNFPFLFIYLIKIKYFIFKERDRTVCGDTDIVLEGYPRSANSFVSSIFNKYTSLNLSDHTHYIANVMLGLKMEKKIIVLIRDPKDAIISNVSLYIQSQIKDFNRQEQDFDDIFISALLDLSIKRYERFYNRIEDNENILFLPFYLITTDINQSFENINNFFSLSISLPTDSFTLSENIINEGGYHLGPSKERDLIKERINSIFKGRDEDIYKSSVIYKNIINKIDLKR